MKKGLLIVLCVAVAYAAAHERVGSVIHSFAAVSGTYDACGVARTGSYLTVPVNRGTQTWFYRFTPGGSLIATYYLWEAGWFEGTDKCHLGENYLAVVPAIDDIYFFTTNGSVVENFYLGPNVDGPELLWDGTYYQCLAGYPRRYFYRYTTAGSMMGSWTPMSWPASLGEPGGVAYLTRFNDVAGSYVVVTSASSGVGAAWTSPGGSLVATFTTAAGATGYACGGASSKPSMYGDVLWVRASPYVYELDMGNGPGNAIAPASLGKVKVLFR